MRTLGIDLAAEAKGTAFAQIEWSGGKAKLVELEIGVGDSRLVEISKVSEKTGIDCALGWPIEFVEFLNAHSRSENRITADFGSIDWRRRVSFRGTDRRVHAVTGRWPLSVANDRLGVTALRAAGLTSRMAAAGLNVDRTGQGHLVEVYPGAALRIWNFNREGYRIDLDARARLLSEVISRAPWLDLSGKQASLIESCDAFDAVMASLITRASWLGKIIHPDAIEFEAAKIESWIALPDLPFEKLADSK